MKKSFTILPVSAYEDLNSSPPEFNDFTNQTRRRPYKQKRFYRNPDFYSQRFTYPSNQTPHTFLPSSTMTAPPTSLCQPISKQPLSWQTQNEASFYQQQSRYEAPNLETANLVGATRGLSDQMGAMGSEIHSRQNSTIKPIGPMPPIAPFNPIYPLYPMRPVGPINPLGQMTPLVPINQIGLMAPIGLLERTSPVSGDPGKVPLMSKNNVGGGNGYIFVPPLMPPYSSWNGNAFPCVNVQPMWPPLTPQMSAPLPTPPYFPINPTDQHWFKPPSSHLVKTTPPKLKKNDKLKPSVSPCNQLNNTTISETVSDINFIPYSSAGKLTICFYT